MIGASFHVPDVSLIDGRFPLDAWEPFTSSHLAGTPVVVDDTQTDQRIPAEVKSGYAQIEVGSDLATPVIAGGQLRCTLGANQRTPRVWTAREVALVHGVARWCWAEVERARAETNLRESEERQAFLLHLSDALRPLKNPREVQQTASRLLGERFLVNRALYAEIVGEGDAAYAAINGQYVRGVSPVPERVNYQHLTHGFPGELWRQGLPVLVEDSETDPRFEPSLREAWRTINTRATLAIPLVKGGARGRHLRTP